MNEKRTDLAINEQLFGWQSTQRTMPGPESANATDSRDWYNGIRIQIGSREHKKKTKNVKHMHLIFKLEATIFAFVAGTLYIAEYN